MDNLPPLPLDNLTNYVPFLNNHLEEHRKLCDDERVWNLYQEPGNDKQLLIKSRNGAFGRDLTWIWIDCDNLQDYTREADVPLSYDDHSNDTTPFLPQKKSGKCGKPSCRLGCICSSIFLLKSQVTRTYCLEKYCLDNFGCVDACRRQLGVSGKPDEGSIRSRLRPRVAISNWKDKSQVRSTYANYRQLEGIIDPPARKERRATTASPMKLPSKLLASASRNRRASSININQQHSIAKGGKTTAQRSTPRDSVIAKAKPILPAIKMKKNKLIKPSVMASNPPKKIEALEVPNLVSRITEDAQLLVLEDMQLCFFAWYLKKKPKVVIYKEMEGDIMSIPWLYLPIPSQEELWLIYVIREGQLKDTNMVFIPELNCQLSSKYLLNYFDLVRKERIGRDIKICWCGNDNMERNGSIFIFPELEGVLICGPFNKSQVHAAPQRNSALKIHNAININSLMDSTKKGFTATTALKTHEFYYKKAAWLLQEQKELQRRSEYERVKGNALREIAENEADSSDDDEDIIPPDAYVIHAPGFIGPGEPGYFEADNMVGISNGPEPKQNNCAISWKLAKPFSPPPRSTF